MPKLDCGHEANREYVTFCNTCIEGIVARAEKLEKEVLLLKASLSNVTEEYKILLRLTGTD